MPNLVSLTCPSLQILGKTLSKSSFRNPSQSLIKENCHNSRTSDDIDMKFGPVTKRDTRNKITSKKFDDDVVSANCEVSVIFPIYGQFGTIRKLDSGLIICKTYISQIVTFFLTKTEKRTKKCLTQLLHYCFE